MENIFLVKIQTNVNQRRDIHDNFLSEVSHTINIRIFEGSKLEWFFFLYKDQYFSLPGWTGSCILRYLNAEFQPVGP